MKTSHGFGVVHVVLIGAIILLGAGAVYVNTHDKNMEVVDDTVQVRGTQNEVREEAGSVPQGDVTADTNAVNTVKETVDAPEGADDMDMKKTTEALAQASGVYTTYAADAIAEKGKTVLFFHASWCPSCRSADADIIKNINSIPSDVTILKTDYDKEVALKQKYGVTTQHTFVEIDAEGNMIEKWSGGSFVDIVSRL